jgi:hypothetical protein
MISMLSIEIFSKILGILWIRRLPLTLAIIAPNHAMMQVFIEKISIGVGMKSELLKPAEVAARMRVSVGTLANWRYQGVGPSYIKLSSASNAPVRYRRDAIDAYMRLMEQGVAA